MKNVKEMRTNENIEEYRRRWFRTRSPRYKSNQILDQFPVRLLLTAIRLKCANDWHVLSVWFFV